MIYVIQNDHFEYTDVNICINRCIYQRHVRWLNIFLRNLFYYYLIRFSIKIYMAWLCVRFCMTTQCDKENIYKKKHLVGQTSSASSLGDVKQSNQARNSLGKADHKWKNIINPDKQLFLVSFPPYPENLLKSVYWNFLVIRYTDQQTITSAVKTLWSPTLYSKSCCH